MMEILILVIVITVVCILLYLMCMLIEQLLKYRVSKFIKLIVSMMISLTVISMCFFRIIDSRKYQFYGGLISNKQTTRQIVALTLDDGPTKEYTEGVLKILKEKNIKATFFLTGKELKEELDLGKEIVQDGHQIGNHSYSHERMVFKSLTFIENEIETTNRLIKEIGYDKEIVFRSPYGKKFLLLPYYLNQIHMKNIMWGLEPESIPNIANDSEQISKYIMENVEPGSIILLHTMYKSREESRKALPKIIDGLKNKGFEFVTVSQLLNE